MPVPDDHVLIKYVGGPLDGYTESMSHWMLEQLLSVQPGPFHQTIKSNGPAVGFYRSPPIPTLHGLRTVTMREVEA